MRKLSFFLWWVGMSVQLLFLLAGCSEIDCSNCPPVTLQIGTHHHSHRCDHQEVVLDNGIVRVSFSTPEGTVLQVSYHGINNVLEAHNHYDDRGYSDVVWNDPQGHGNYWRISGSKFSIIAANDDQVEISFLSTWDSSMPQASVPMNVDKRYILRRGCSGFYSYAIFERLEGFPAYEMSQVRIVYKLAKDMFHYMAISDDRQRNMPTPEDVKAGQRLGYKEAVLLDNPSNPEFQGEVDDKYQYTGENKDIKVHGWISFNNLNESSVGFWMIIPSNEFRNAGPIKQSLTSHVGPVTLNSYVATHYAGTEVTMAFQEGETYKKVFGPVFHYLNSVQSPYDSQTLWRDAVQQMSKEVKSWPYDFVQSTDYFPPNQRGAVAGRLLVQEQYNRGGRFILADQAYVGLALPGDVGSWQRESKGYQFWTQADSGGYFTIENVIPGDYNLYAWVPGFLGDYKYNLTITITPGRFVQLGSLIYRPPRNGPTVWEIGIPDRSASEFYIPDPDPKFMNQLFKGKQQHKFRQYGLWQRYTELYPTDDLVYTIGASHYSNDWFYAQVTRNLGNDTFTPTTWQIVFELPFVMTGNYTLQLALAAASASRLGVRFNNARAQPAHFDTGVIGQDNAIARHGIHGLYWRYSIEVPSYLLMTGRNDLRQAKGNSPYQGVMYDYIRLERPPV